MRSSTLLLAGPLAVSAQVLTTITGRVQTATISSGSEVLYTTTWTYSNPATNYLTLTDSEGVSETARRDAAQLGPLRAIQLAHEAHHVHNVLTSSADKS